MPRLPLRSEISIGMSVFVELKQDMGTGNLTEGVVKQILTSGEEHPYGIMVELEDGNKGRVKSLDENSLFVTNSKSHVTIPNDKDESNEFKSSFKADYD